MDEIIAKLTNAGLKVKVKGDTITTWAKTDSHPREERVEIVVGVDGKVIRSSKYAYLLPDSIGDDVRLA